MSSNDSLLKNAVFSLSEEHREMLFRANALFNSERYKESIRAFIELTRAIKRPRMLVTRIKARLGHAYMLYAITASVVIPHEVFPRMKPKKKAAVVLKGFELLNKAVELGELYAYEALGDYYECEGFPEKAKEEYITGALKGSEECEDRLMALGFFLLRSGESTEDTKDLDTIEYCDASDVASEVTPIQL